MVFLIKPKNVDSNLNLPSLIRGMQGKKSQSHSGKTMVFFNNIEIKFFVINNVKNMLLETIVLEIAESLIKELWFI